MTGYLTFLTQDCLRLFIYKERTRNMALFNILDNIFWLWSTLCWSCRPQVDVISASHQTPSASSTQHIYNWTYPRTWEVKPADQLKWFLRFLEDHTPSTFSTWGPKCCARQQFHDDFFSLSQPHTDQGLRNLRIFYHNICHTFCNTAYLW